MLTSKSALYVRILIFILSGPVAALPFVTLDEASGDLCIKLAEGAEYIVAGIWGSINTGTFAWSRWAKSLGGVT